MSGVPTRDDLFLDVVSQTTDTQHQNNTNNSEANHQHSSNHNNQQQDDSHLPCAWYIRAVPSIIFLSFLLGITVGTTSAIVPNLQQDTFGNNTFVWVGVLSGGKGIMALVYTPIVGSLTDERSHYNCLMAVLVLSLIPYAAMAISNNFLSYMITNMVVGLYNLTLVLLVIIIASRVPQIHKGRTIALSVNVAAFMFGVGGSSFLGPVFSGRVAFIISVGAQLLMIAAAAYFLRRTDDTPNLEFVAEKEHLIHDHNNHSSHHQHDDDDDDASSRVVVASETSPLLLQNNNNNNNNNNKDDDQHHQQQEQEPTRSATDSESTNNNNNVTSKATEKFLLLLQQEHQHDGTIVGHALRAWNLFWENRNIKVLFGVAFWNYLTADMFDQMLLLYLQDTLNFSNNDQTYTIAVMSASSIFFVLFVLATRDRISDVWVLRVALTSSTIMSLLYAFVTNKIFAIFLPMVNIFGMAALPAVSSLTVDSVAPSDIGVAQGLTAAARVAAGAVCPFLYGELFQVTQNSSVPGSPFLFAAGCIVLSILTTFLLKF